MSKKIAIFPVNHDSVALVRYSHLGDFMPIALLAPELNILEGADISKLDGGEYANITLRTDYNQGIQESDALILTRDDLIRDKNIYKALMHFAETENKELLLSSSVSEWLNIERSSNVSPKYSTFGDSLSSDLLNIEAPIISIFGIGYNCGITHTEFLAREFFLSSGYKVLQLGSAEYSQFLGCVNFPYHLFDSGIDDVKKAVMFNRFVHDLNQQFDPDLIIIASSCPIMKYSDDILNGLGIVPFIMQNAIKSDIGIVNLYYTEYSYEYLNMISQLSKYRFGVSVGYFGLSNVSANRNPDQVGKMEYLRLETDFVKSNYKSSIGREQYTIFPAYDRESAYAAFRKIEIELQANIQRV